MAEEYGMITLITAGGIRVCKFHGRRSRGLGHSHTHPQVYPVAKTEIPCLPVPHTFSLIEGLFEGHLHSYEKSVESGF